MYPLLMLTLFLSASGWMILREQKRRPTSAALWIAFIWCAILASRPVSSWLGVGSIEAGVGGYAAATSDYLQGNALDRTVQLALILGGFLALRKRGVSWGAVMRENGSIFLLYLYFALSTLWAEYPVVTFKRWFKEFGNIVMVLVILSEGDAVTTIKTLYTRCAYLLIPLSCVLVKYFPELGRTITPTGWQTYTGVAGQKNSLAMLVVSFGLVVFWEAIEARDFSLRSPMRIERLGRLALLVMGAWLLHMASSASGMVCAVLGAGLLWVSRTRLYRTRPKMLVIHAAVVGVLLLGLDSAFNVFERLVQVLGRDMTFTGRSLIWELVETAGTNPVLGIGFCSFWSSALAQNIWDNLVPMVSAHNGYLEVYLDGGIIGVVLLILMLLSAFRRVYRGMTVDRDFGGLQFAICCLLVGWNFSESIFLRPGLLWFTFLLVVLSLPGARGVRSPADAGPEAEPVPAGGPGTS